MSWFTDDNKTRKGRWPVWDYMFKYFPLAFLEEVRVSVLGNEQHNPGQPLHWAREKSTDQLNTAFRHQFDYAEAKARGIVVPRDVAGHAVLAQAIWRLKAQLQLDLEEENRQKSSVPVPSIESYPEKWLNPASPCGACREFGCACNDERKFTTAARCGCTFCQLPRPALAPIDDPGKPL